MSNLSGNTSDIPPMVAESVLNFGLPAMSGQLVSKIDISLLERTIRQAILRFEPRLLPDSLKVVALEATHVLDTHNTIEFEIRGHLAITRDRVTLGMDSQSAHRAFLPPGSGRRTT